MNGYLSGCLLGIAVLAAGSAAALEPTDRLVLTHASPASTTTRKQLGCVADTKALVEHAFGFERGVGSSTELKQVEIDSLRLTPEELARANERLKGWNIVRIDGNCLPGRMEIEITGWSPSEQRHELLFRFAPDNGALAFK